MRFSIAETSSAFTVPLALKSPISKFAPFAMPTISLSTDVEEQLAARSFRQSLTYGLLPVFQNLGRRDLTELSDKNSGYNIVNSHCSGKDYRINIQREYKIYSACDIRNKQRKYLIYDKL